MLERAPAEGIIKIDRDYRKWWTTTCTIRANIAFVWERNAVAKKGQSERKQTGRNEMDKNGNNARAREQCMLLAGTKMEKMKQINGE